jgi:hypothetical protein
MTAKEKAKTLINNFYNLRGMDWDMSISCSLITVNEILNSNPHSNPFNTSVYSTMEFWKEVKSEIEKL